MYVEIIDNKQVIVDNKDIFLKKQSWSVSKNKNMFYVRSGQTYLHRLVTEAKAGEIVDHINGNGLDNRRSNLRVVTRQFNRANAFHGKKSSKYVGVSYIRSSKKYRSQIKINNVNKHIGCFDSEDEAAKEYNKEAIRIYGDKAFLNEIVENV